MAALGGLRRLRSDRGWLAGLAGLWLVGVLLVAAPASASHPPATLEIAAAGGESLADPTLIERLPPATPGTAALICLALLVLPGILAARQWRRTLLLTTVALFLWFSAEATFHSAHHLTDPGEERCPLFAAAQHLPGTDPEPAVPVLDRPAPNLAVLLAPTAVGAPVVLDGEQARAPPPRPA